MSPRVRRAVEIEDAFCRRWRDQCMRNARAMRREAEEHERAGCRGLAEKATRRVRFWVREARAWNRSLFSWRR